MPAPYTPPNGLAVNLNFQGAYVHPQPPLALRLNFAPTGTGGGSPLPPTISGTQQNFMTLLLM